MNKDNDIIGALISANAFYRAAKNIVDKIEEKDFRISDVFVASSNYGISIEIYLKALLILNGLEAPKSHKLNILFEKFPFLSKNKIIEVFNNRRKDSKSACLWIRLRDEGSNESREESNFAFEGDLLGLLRRNGDIFVKYRYFFEEDLSLSWKTYCFEYADLSLLSNLLNEYCQGYLMDEDIERLNIW